MSPRDLVYVGHMLDMARKAVSKAQGLSREAYDADENLGLALIHLIQVMGESARQVAREFSDAHPEIQWADSIGIRTKSSTTTSVLMKTSSGRSSRTSCRSWWRCSSQLCLLVV